MVACVPFSSIPRQRNARALRAEIDGVPAASARRREYVRDRVEQALGPKSMALERQY
jgi:hypothetical protein